MAEAVVFAFAVDDGLRPVVGAAPLDVLARQLPRTLVAHLNGGGDRGVRFFPFLGPIDGQRGFLRLRELLAPEQLIHLHRQGDVRWLADGLLLPDCLRWRIVDGRSGDVLLTLDLPFDPRCPTDVLPRLEFELVGCLGWTGVRPVTSAVQGEALAWFLVLKDELLRREANLAVDVVDPLRAAWRCVELAADDPEVQHVIADFVALLLRRAEPHGDAARLLHRLADSVGDVDLLERLGGLALAAGDAGIAAELAVRTALQRPTDGALVERAAAMAFRQRRDDDVRRVVQAARGAGAVTPAALAQLAAVCDRSGDLEGRAALVRELVGQDDLPVPVARLLVSFLIEEDQPSLARTLIERALEKAPDQAMLHFELGRACLLLDDASRASVAMQRALELGLDDPIAEQARRLLRLSLVPGLWAGTQLVEKALADRDLAAALGAVRALLRRVGRVAEAWLLFGIVWQRLDRPRRARRCLRRALQCHEPCADAHNRLGVLLLHGGEVDEGVRHLERAHELAPGEPSILLHLAQGCALRGRLAEAERHLDAAAGLGADPDLVVAVRREIFAGRTG